MKKLRIVRLAVIGLLLAGAVALAAAVAVIVGLLVIGPPLWSKVAD